MTFEELIEEHNKLKRISYENDSKMVDLLINFDGSVIEAIKLGMVRPNFPTGANALFKRWLYGPHHEGDTNS